MTAPTSERTAIHEAGHVVATLALGLAVNTVTIVQDGDALGCVTGPNVTYGYESTSTRDRQGQQRDAIVSLFAGRAAEHVLCGEPFTFDEASGAASDYDQAWQLMLSCHVRYSSWVGDDKYDRAFERLQRQALHLVRRDAPAIRRVAAALTTHQTLTGADLRALIDAGGC